MYSEIKVFEAEFSGRVRVYVLGGIDTEIGYFEGGEGAGAVENGRGEKDKIIDELK